MKFYDAGQNRVVCVAESATSQFWDDHWNAPAPKELKLGRPSRLVLQTTARYLPTGATVIEGGCGLGQNVLGLADKGFKAVGIDYAEETVRRVKEAYPGLDIRYGDVQALPLETASADGYWSLGVIEHFYDGYGAIASEMHRVLRPGGFLFLTFPYMSPLRRWKAGRGGFPAWKETPEQKKAFYQFMLDQRRVVRHMESLGFERVREEPYDALKGLKDELFENSALLKAVYNGRAIWHRGARFILGLLLGRFSSHAVLLVLRKR